MPKKRFFIVKQISEKDYFEEAAKAGKTEDKRTVNRSIAGCMQLEDKVYLGYTEEDVLEVSLEEEE
jgi:hypothetical protein